MADDSTKIERWIDARATGDAPLTALVPATDITPYETLSDTDRRRIVYYKASGVDEKVVNRGFRHDRHNAIYRFDVWGAVGERREDLEPIINRLDELFNIEDGTPVDGGLIESSERIGMPPTDSAMEGGRLIPRRTLEFRIVAMAS